MNFTDKSFRSTLIVNYLAAFVIAASPLVSIPFYLHVLGLENWSYIGYMLLTQGIFAIIDSGLVLAFMTSFSEQIKLEKQNVFVLLRSLEKLASYLLILVFQKM